jgi:hypothetical protein
VSAVYKRTPPRWGHADLTQLREDAKAGLSLREMAERQGPGVTQTDCDLALWALAGRTIPEACDALAAGA